MATAVPSNWLAINTADSAPNTMTFTISPDLHVSPQLSVGDVVYQTDDGKMIVTKTDRKFSKSLGDTSIQGAHEQQVNDLTTQVEDLKALNETLKRRLAAVRTVVKDAKKRDKFSVPVQHLEDALDTE